MKINYAQINMSGMVETLTQLYNQGRFPSIGTTYRVLKLKKAVDKAVEEARVLFKQLLEQYVVHENGKPKPSQDGAFILSNDTPEGRKAFEEANEAFGNTEVELGDLKKLKLSEIEKAMPMTARQLDAIAPFIEDLSSAE
jgi:hypothetical protein